MLQLKKLISPAIVAFAVIIASTPQSHAALLAYDPFDSDPGVLTGSASGFGFTGGWAQNGGNINNSRVVAGSFTFMDNNGYSLVSSGNRAHVTGDGSATGDNTGGTTGSASPLRLLNFGRGLSGGAETTWVSMLSLRTGLPNPAPAAAPNDYLYGRAVGTQFFYQSTTATTAGNEQFSIGRATQSSETDTSWVNDTWTVSQQGNANGQKVSNANFAEGDADFLLIRIDHIGSTVNDVANADTIHLWINPSDLNVMPSDGTADVVFNANEFAGSLALNRDWIFNRIRLFGGGLQGTSYGAFDLDELRIGETFADVTPNVIPEPATGMLMGLGLLALIARRRR